MKSYGACIFFEKQTRVYDFFVFCEDHFSGGNDLDLNDSKQRDSSFDRKSEYIQVERPVLFIKKASSHE